MDLMPEFVLLSVDFVSRQFLHCLDNLSRSPEVRVVNENGYIEFGGHNIKVKAFSPGKSIVLVKRSGNLYCLEQDQWNNYQKEQAAKAEANRLAKEKTLKEKEEANVARIKEFYNRYTLPIEPGVCHIGHLNALTVNSSGNGVTRATVNHFLMLQDLSHGRIQRKKGDALCKASGKDYADSSQQEIKIDFNSLNIKLTPVITCKACLRIMERWKISKAK